MPKTPAPRAVVFAGPNDADKSTHANAILASLDIDIFFNADHIARGLSVRNADTVDLEEIASSAMLQIQRSTIHQPKTEETRN
jgi:predicted ABC-type ATPase